MLTTFEHNELLAFLHEYDFFSADLDEIINCYTSPHRKYHTLEHVKLMLDLRDSSINSATATEMPMSVGDQFLIQAIVLHDIVYPAKPVVPGLNEYYSAKWATDHGADKQVAEAIVATGFYMQDQNHLSVLAMELCDLDLSNLALPYEEFNRWCKLALDEVAYFYFPQVDDLLTSKAQRALLEGQASFFSNIISRNNIYYRHPDWEPLARDNIEHKLDELDERIDHDTR